MKNNIPQTIIYAFKVKDYTTVLFGQRVLPENGHDGYFYIQRGDGTQYQYLDYRIEWFEEIYRN